MYYLGECILLFRGESNVAEQEHIILVNVSEMSLCKNVESWQDDWTASLVECIVDLSKLVWCELTGVDALDLATKVNKVRWIRRGRKWQRGQFDGHG